MKKNGFVPLNCLTRKKKGQFGVSCYIIQAPPSPASKTGFDPYIRVCKGGGGGGRLESRV